MRRILSSKVVIFLFVFGAIAALITFAIASQFGTPAALGALAFFNATALFIPYWRTRDAIASSARRVNDLNKLANSSVTSNQNSINSLEVRILALSKLLENRPLSGTQIGYNSELLADLQDQYAVIKDQLSGTQALLQEILVSLDLRVPEKNHQL